MKKREKINQEDILTKLEQLKLEYEDACLYNYELLKVDGIAYFEEDGTVLTEDKDGKYIRSGRDHILRIINFFVSKDEVHFYQKCAFLKKILDEYDVKFSPEKKTN